MSDLSHAVEDALAACGRERVLHRDDSHGPSIAIRYDIDARVTSADGTERFLVRNANTLDEAGFAAARDFALRVREQAKAMDEWADRIERSLKNRAEP